MTDKLDHDQRAVVSNLIALARATYFALEDAEEVEGFDGTSYLIPIDNIHAITDVLEQLDALPDDRPGCIMTGPAKAEWALRMREESFDARIELRIAAAQLRLRVHVEILGNRAERDIAIETHRALRDLFKSIKYGVHHAEI